MTTHKLSTHGSRKTACGLKVPPIFEVKPTSTTWDDGDGPRTGICVDCHPIPTGTDAPAPSAPRPGTLQRFNVVASSRKGGPPQQLGNAVVNRDGTISCYLGALPVDGKLTLVPS